MIAVITGSTSAGTDVPHPTRTAAGFGHVPGARLVFTALAVVVSITGMWLMFRWVIARLPRQPVRLRRAMHAAWFGAIGFEILKQAFAIYLDSVTASPTGKLGRKNLPAPAPSGPWSASVPGSTAGCPPRTLD